MNGSSIHISGKEMDLINLEHDWQHSSTFGAAMSNMQSWL
jgi:hypothetical protein